ncbi:hypothetical protein LOZ80_25845 [Paenibacillus sp. HWE-109]|uniref:hypothetical protein n=1 Tax=Paenibacillus sp. HWE-109 TaxID=1306526 RepID=UPI001EDDC199|nr:hypothetical protein [Paenibacillus sp. HWE-109]UKS25004.1 hypothetical protein LOZ80_25845 [Paenibacillus sp. HWE-109]
MSEIETIFRERYNDYYVVVQKFNDGKFGVLVFPHNSNTGQLVESVITEHHALKGAEKVHIFYDIAISKGYRLDNGYFRNANGHNVHGSFAMDLDADPVRFTNLFS